MRFRSVGREGVVEASFDRAEFEVLEGLPTQLAELLELGEGEVRERLFPRAYLDPTEDAAEKEWQRLMHSDLLASKMEALVVVTETLRRATDSGGADVRVELAADEVHAWLGALNDLRLALGVMLEVDDGLDLDQVRPDDPRAPGLHLYGWLTWIQGNLLEAVGF